MKSLKLMLCDRKNDAGVENRDYYVVCEKLEPLQFPVPGCHGQ